MVAMDIAESYNWPPGTTGCIYCYQEFQEGDSVTFTTPQHTGCEDERFRRQNSQLCIKCGKPYAEEPVEDYQHTSCVDAKYEGYGA